MDNQIEEVESEFYEIQVGGIKCTNCAKKIVDNIDPLEQVKKTSVNVMQEKVQIEVYSPNKKQKNNKPALERENSQIFQDPLTIVQDKLEELNFKILQQPKKLLLNNDKTQREIFLNIKNPHNQPNQEIKAIIEKNITGVIAINIQNMQFQDEQETLEDQYLQVGIVYNTEINKGTKIFDKLKQIGLDFEVNDQIYLDFFSNSSGKKLKNFSKKQMIFCFTMLAYLVIVQMILPNVMEDNKFKGIFMYPDGFSMYLTSIIISYVITMKIFGWKVYKSAYSSWKNFNSYNMETLISLGSVSAAFMGVYLIFQYQWQNYGVEQQDEMMNFMKLKKIAAMFKSGSVIILIVTIGKYIEGRAKQSILKMIDDIFPRFSPKSQTNPQQENMYNVIEPKNRNLVIKEEKQYNISLLDKETILKLEGPQRLWTDVVVLQADEGFSAIDQVCYGEDSTQVLQKGDKIRCGSNIVKGQAIVKIENPIEQTLLAKISQEINMSHTESQNQEEGVQIILKNLSKYFIKGVMTIAAIMFIIWNFFIYFDVVDASAINPTCTYCTPFERCISILVASCPCALGLAIPSVVAITLNLALKSKILIKNVEAFEKILKVKSIVFDKTGTLLTKSEEIQEIVIVEDEKNDNILELAPEKIWQIITLIEKDSIHPIAEVLYKEGLNQIPYSQNLDFVKTGKVQQQMKGIECDIQQKSTTNDLKVKIGNYSYMQENNIQLTSEKYLQEFENMKAQNLTTIFVAINSEIVMIIGIDNSKNLREEAYFVVNSLRNYFKKEVYILSGDNKESVSQVAKTLNIPEKNIYSEVNQDEKLNIIKELKNKNKNNKYDGVMMIGDGLNDILSLKQADVGVSINSKSDLNLAAADIILLSQDLKIILSLFKLIQWANIFIKVNLFLAFFYNMLMIPLSSGLFYKFNIVISPTIASLCMSFSSLSVVGFSNLLRCFNFDFNISTKQKQNINQQQIKKKGQSGHVELINEPYQ